MLAQVAVQAFQASAALYTSHLICVSIIMYHDFTGKWSKYALNKNRDVSMKDYKEGAKNFMFDLIFLFYPFMTWCFWYRYEAINLCTDSALVAFAKLGMGYVLGKVWAYWVHYTLHSPALYKYHRRHHRNPKHLVAASAWEDSMIEYMVMELPSFGFAVVLFPTHFYVHLVHFMWHGWDGACGHSGFKAPGLFGAIFDGEYHYIHHAHLTVNYGEIEWLDKFFRTHHTQTMMPHQQKKNAWK